VFSIGNKYYHMIEIIYDMFFYFSNPKVDNEINDCMNDESKIER